MTQGLTSIPGIKVGIVSDLEAATGVTVVLAEGGAYGAVEVRGSAPGTRETDLLRPGQLVEQVQAILLAGGSAFGLNAAAGVMRYLEEENQGFPVGPYNIPIVPGAVLFDLFIGSGDVRPDEEMGYQACRESSSLPVPEGSVGAGTGATVAKISGPLQAVKSGQGSAAVLSNGLIVAALVVVNAFGDVYDRQGNLLAGPRDPGTMKMQKTLDLLVSNENPGFPGNTTLAVVATNANIKDAALTKICQMAHDGLARSIWPVHTMWDGDTVFALSKGNVNADVNLVGLLAAEAVSSAVERAVQKAETLCGIPAASELE